MDSYWNPLAESRDVVPDANKCVDRDCLDGVAHDMAVAPALIVIHTMVGTWQSAEGRFENPNDVGHASATYGVKLDGGLIQWVDEKDAAYHAGNYAANMDSIGLEHEDAGDYNGPRTPQLYASSARLVADIAKRYGVPLVHINRADYEAGRSGVIAHREISDSPTACPDALDVDRIIAQAAGTQPQEDDMYNDNDRSVAARILGLLSQGQQYNVDGSPIPGAPRWLAQKQEEILAALATGKGSADTVAILAAIEDLKNHNPDDAGLLDKINALSAHLGIGTA